MLIPQCDPRANYRAHKDEIDAAIAAVLEGGSYILGHEVARFEQEFASYLGAAHAIGVASGTDALQLALRACGIGPGDRVLTVSHTAVATVAAIELTGAVPVFADIDPATFTIDCGEVEQALRKNWGGPLNAIVAVHLYGHPAAMPALIEIAGRHGLWMIEDCAQSHGAAIDGRKTGAWGHIAAFSFYPTKNLGSLGDGGAVVTSDAALADRVRSLREYGWRERYISEEPGLNSRLDELQAAILRVKLRYLNADNHRRDEIARAYGEVLRGPSLLLPRAEGVVHAWHQYVIRSPQRDRLRLFLREQGIGTLVHYPVPVHLQPAYRGRLRQGALDRTEQVAREILSLPMFPELTPDKVEQVGRAVATHA